MLDRRDALRRLVLNSARLSGAASLASRVLSGSGAILMLHRVNNRPPSAIGYNEHLTVAPGFVDAVIRDMKELGYEFISLDGVHSRLAQSGPRGKFAAITLDDAYLDNLTDALPVFERHGTPITIYVAPGLISGDVQPWWEIIEELVESRDRLYLPMDEGALELDCSDLASKRAAVFRIEACLTETVSEEAQQEMLRRLAQPSDGEVCLSGQRRFINWDELRALSKHPLVTLGAHTVNHFNLRRLPEPAALGEMIDSAAMIEAETGARPRHFAYPYGYQTAVGPRETELAAQAGFATAVTTRHGCLQPEHRNHLHALPRLSLNGRFQKTGHVRTMLSGLTAALANSGRTLVTV